MAAPTVIRDPQTGDVARVTALGQLVVAPLSFSTPVQKRLAVVSQVVNVVAPSPGQQIIITDVIVSGAKDVSSSVPAEVVVYSASSATSATVLRLVLRLPAARGAVVPITGLNLNIGGGVWLNATTDDATVDLTVAYYYAPVEYP